MADTRLIRVTIESANKIKAKGISASVWATKALEKEKFEDVSLVEVNKKLLQTLDDLTATIERCKKDMKL